MHRNTLHRLATAATLALLLGGCASYGTQDNWTHLVDGTRGLFNAQRIASMKPGSILINTSRGHIVDVAAVAQSLKSGHLGGAALDVFDEEPMKAEPMFEGCPNLILTPHISGVTYEGNERVSFMIADLVLKALK